MPVFPGFLEIIRVVHLIVLSISKEFRQNMLLIKKKIYVNYWKLRKDTTISILKYFCVCFVDYELEMMMIK